MTISKLLDWFIHPKLQETAIIYSRAKNIVGSAIVGAIVIPIYALLYYILHDYASAVAVLLVSVMLASALSLLKFYGKIIIARSIILGTLLTLFFFLSYMQGAILSPTTYWILLVPVLAVFFSGLSSGIIWATLSILGIVTLYWLQATHAALPNAPTTEVLILQAAAICGLAVVILALVFFFKLSEEQGFKQLEHALKVIQNKSQELSQTNQELQELATKTNAILAAEADGIITTNDQWIIDSYNHAVSEIFNYDTTELLGRSLKTLLSPRYFTENHLISDAEKINLLFEQTKTLHELEGRRKDGKLFPLELAISMIHANRNKLHICVIRDITHRKESEAKLAHLAHYDHLTSLPNRALYETMLNKAIAKAERTGKLIAVFYLDLDYFKNINDTLGHDIGDLLLKEVAQRLVNHVRKTDTVARLGGDEFTVIVEELNNTNQAAIIAQNILNALSHPLLLSGQEVFTSTSIGIAIYPENGKDVVTLTKNADIAMYNAKEQGRRNYSFFTHELNKKNTLRISLEKNLHKALERNEFVIHYQPQINAKTNDINAIEALLRWQNSTHGLISPTVFIPIAEKLGLINKLGEWILETACAQFRVWLDSGLINESAKITVNLASQQLKQNNLAFIIENILNKTNLSSKHIELELTEAAIMANQKVASITLQNLKKTGVSIAIDNFGSGYSSFSFLKHLPINTLKIDKSFIKDIPNNLNNDMIVRAIIALGHGLELKVIAEGVETAEQLNYLVSNNCDFVQGHYISKPLPSNEMAALLRQSKLKLKLET